MTNLLETIQTDIDGTTSLSKVLRSATVLAFRLKNQELRDWVDRELNGYPDGSTVPDYRVLPTASFGTFTNGFRTIQNVAIPLNVFPDDTREQFHSMAMRQGIRELESMLETCVRSGEGTLHSRYPGITTHYLANRVFADMVCLSAWRSVSQAGLTGILDAVRNRLLTLTLELAERYPAAAQLDFNTTAANPSSERLAQVINYTINGDHHTFQAGTNSQQRQEVLTVRNEVNVGDGNTFQGDFVVAHAIEQSFNRAAASDLADPVKELLKQLATETGKMIKVLPAEQAQQAARDVETLRTEATSKTPRKQWIQLSGEGLMKAATNIGKIGLPVIELVNKLYPLLPG